jgi:hypothetical protein
MNKDAVILGDNKEYRYYLSRIWEADKPLVLFVMLNPSTADADDDDPTIRRCINFAKTWGYGGILVGNLYAYRSTDPAALLNLQAPVKRGPLCDHYLKAMGEKAQLVIIACGSHKAVNIYRMNDVAKLFTNVKCLARNKNNFPKHPLYVKGDTQPIEF